MEPQKSLKEALAVYVFSLYVLDLMRKGLINKDRLPSKFDFHTGTRTISIDYRLNHQSAVSVAHNTVIACLGACVNTFNSVLEKTFRPSIKKLVTKDNAIDDITAARAIINQLRNAFAHGPEEPKWHVTNTNFLRALQVEQIDLKVDLQALNGQPIIPTQIGGYKGIFDLLTYCIAQVERKEAQVTT